MEFTEYVARQRPALMRFATVLTCRTWLAEELVSDVLGRAFERWDRISGLDEPHAYVRRKRMGGARVTFKEHWLDVAGVTPVPLLSREHVRVEPSVGKTDGTTRVEGCGDTCLRRRTNEQVSLRSSS